MVMYELQFSLYLQHFTKCIHGIIYSLNGFHLIGYIFLKCKSKLVAYKNDQKVDINNNNNDDDLANVFMLMS